MTKEDKPKIRNRCGSCAAFHAPFCIWEYKPTGNHDTDRALHVDSDAYACSLYFPRLEFDSAKNFKRKVTAL